MAPMFQELINKWVNVNRSHYANGEKYPLPYEPGKVSSSLNKTQSNRAKMFEEEGTAVTSASSAMTPGSNPVSIKSRGTINNNDIRLARTRKNGSQGGVYQESQLTRTIQSSLHQVEPQATKLDNSKAQDFSKPKKSSTSRRKSKSKKGLRRTHSQSDLLLSKFDENEKKNLKASRQGKSQQGKKNSVPYDPKYESSSNLKNKDEYLNTATFSQQWQQNNQQSYQVQSSVKNKRNKKPHHGMPLPPNPHNQQLSHQTAAVDPEEEIMAVFHQNKVHHAHPYHSFQTRPDMQSNQGIPQDNVPIVPSDDQEPCEACAEMEKKLRMMQSDIEYLRSLALNEENMCSSCRNYPDADQLSCTSSITSHFHGHSHQHSAHHNQNPSSAFTSLPPKKKIHPHLHTGNYTVKTMNTPSTSHSSYFCDSSINADGKIIENASLMEASQRLVDVTIRHQQQIEQMTRERTRWQNDTHLKLTKFAMLCKELNEESAKRKQEYLFAQEELDQIKGQYSAVNMEVELLRAKVALHEKEAEENKEIRETLITNDNDVMDRAEKAIQKRDSVISELSGKLQIAMDTLELERHQQRQRRQIIFPVSKQYHMQVPNQIPEKPSDQESSSLVKSLNEELLQAKAVAKTAKDSLIESNQRALKREDELQKRCEELTEELKNAKTGLVSEDSEQ